MKSLILFPFNGNARESLAVVEAINQKNKEWDVVGFIDDNPDTYKKSFGGVRVIGGRDVLETFNNSYILAVPGRPENFRNRQRIIEGMNIPENRFASLIHPTCAIGPEVSIGKNVLIMAHVTLTAGVTIGDHVVILSGTVIAHEAEVRNFCLIGSNVVISGGVTVEPKCYIGSGSKVIQEITIGTGAMIGMGSVVIRDVLPGSTVAGCPAKRIDRGNT